MRIKCPFCGLRDIAEYRYGGDASKPLPLLSNIDWDDWYDYVYVRDNPRGEHVEYWHHVFGCRHWLRVRRNTLTHDISGVSLARNSLDKG